MKLCELVSIYRFRTGMSLEMLADAVGVSKSTVSRWESGAIKKISKENEARLSEVFEIDVSEYLKFRFFKPVLGVVKAGYDLLADEHLQGYEEVSKRDYDRGDYFLKVIGNSMSGSRIYEGDLIYVKTVSDVESGAIAVVLLQDEEATVKRVIKTPSLLILEATNPEYETRYYTPEDVATLPVRIIGQVLDVRVTF